MLQAYTNILLEKEAIYFDAEGEVALIDTVWALYMILLGYYAVFPRCVIVRNYGYDGTGTNCKELLNVVKSPLVNKYFFEYKYTDNSPKIENINLNCRLRDTIFKEILNLEIICFNYFGKKWYLIIKKVIGLKK